MAKQDNWARITVRMPQDLYDKLQEASANSPLSMNAEIVARLEASLTKRIGEPGFQAEDHSPDELRQQMSELAIRLNNIADMLDKIAEDTTEGKLAKVIQSGSKKPSDDAAQAPRSSRKLDLDP